jgi:hypothetical protein
LEGAGADPGMLTTQRNLARYLTPVRIGGSMRFAQVEDQCCVSRCIRGVECPVAG